MAPQAAAPALIKKVLAWGLGAGLLAWLLARTPIEQVMAALAQSGWSYPSPAPLAGPAH